MDLGSVSNRVTYLDLLMEGGWPEKFDILPHPVRWIGRGIVNLFSMHQLSPISDHKFECPDELASPLESVTDWSVLADVDLSGMAPDGEAE